MKQKRGQFYLIAAILIVVLLIIFATVYNYSSKKSSTTIYDLGEELGIESQNIIDYGTTSGNIDTVLEDFIEDYVNYAGEGKNLYFIFGDSGSMQIKAYENLADVSNSYSPTTGGGKVSVEIDEIVYQFDLEAGYNFYFVVSQEIEGEKYVATNE